MTEVAPTAREALCDLIPGANEAREKTGLPPSYDVIVSSFLSILLHNQEKFHCLRAELLLVPPYVGPPFT